MNSDYCANILRYQRSYQTNVKIGNLFVGGDYPVCIQSMCNIDTNKTDQCVDQAIRIFEAGGEMVRFTVCNATEAESVGKIKQKLVEKGYHFPVIADVHFNPEAAFKAAALVDKVRINPGNFAEKSFAAVSEKTQELSFDEGYRKVKGIFSDFLEICTRNHTAIRIGTNHGSLSKRIVDRYGDTPEGMVEATLEYLRICRDKNFNQVVVSLKSSNVRVMVQAYRLLQIKMKAENMSFPLHLGVTEAGDGEDGRIKSAAGIGTLLADGIGDTIRVSLTGPPETEIPVAKTIVNHIHSFAALKTAQPFKMCYSPYQFSRRKTNPVSVIGNNHLPVVIADASNENEINTDFFQKIISSDPRPDFVYTGPRFINDFHDEVNLITDHLYWEPKKGLFPLFTVEDYLQSNKHSATLNFVMIDAETDLHSFSQQIKDDKTIVFIVHSTGQFSIYAIRSLINRMSESGIKQPVVVYHTLTEISAQEADIKTTINTAPLFIDGLSDGLWLKNPLIDFEKNIQTAFSILQACRVRTTRTEFISCPSCGRTQFDIEKTLAEIKRKTSHLKGLKIAVMGCIVNGPGEMADADYGYVGSGKGMVTLYKGRQIIKRSVPENKAINELIELIKENGEWTDAQPGR